MLFTFVIRPRVRDRPIQSYDLILELPRVSPLLILDTRQTAVFVSFGLPLIAIFWMHFEIIARSPLKLIILSLSQRLLSAHVPYSVYL